MKLGTSGIVLKQAAGELLITSIRKVYAGGMWLDSPTTAAVIRTLVDGVVPSAPPILAKQQAAPKQHPLPPPESRKRIALSQREREIVRFVKQGYKNKEIAEKMFISEQTVKNHLHNIFDKVGVSDRLELALWAISNELDDGS